AEKARSARNLILHSLKLHPSEIEKFDLMDFEVLGPGMNFQKTPSKWSELSKLQRSGIETLAASFSSQASYALLNTPAGRYAFNQAVDISKVYAAHKLVDRHRRLDKEMEDLEGLGFGRNRTWPTLTRAERAMLEEMAQGDWAEVKHDNLFANEGAAMRAMERLLRKMEATAKIDLRWRRKAELSHGSDRAHWRSEPTSGWNQPQTATHQTFKKASKPALSINIQSTKSQMEHKGTVRSIKQNTLIQTNKTLRHCYPRDDSFCRDEFFVLPKGMTRAQALTKIEHASIANKIMKGDRNFDCLQKEMQKDLVLLGFPKGTAWADLTHAQKKKVQSLSLVQAEDGVSESQSTKAAKRIMNNQQRLEEHSDDLEKLGLGENRIWNNLSAAEHKKIKELAESEW
ncbi:hypothetical protein HDU99_006832, partial [Rhizoclosmatium hyalinum]